MTYVYDLILNFENELYEFYEWKSEDKIYHIKRINYVRVNSSVYNDILDNDIVMSDDFLLSIFNKCEYYLNRSVGNIPYAAILTDGYRAMAIMMSQNGKIIKYSSLLLDEEEDILDLCSKMATIKLDYKVISKKRTCDLRTRQEKSIIKYLKKDLANTYKKKNINKLRYLYFEYFNKNSNDIKEIYQSLNNELEKDITEKHYLLYDLIKLSYRHKIV